MNIDQSTENTKNIKKTPAKVLIVLITVAPLTHEYAHVKQADSGDIDEDGESPGRGGNEKNVYAWTNAVTTSKQGYSNITCIIYTAN